ncbi:toll/interleukin-1 receptor domain-containing adapter protein [Sardina pilchardus]|uniref:toll/interleukin-1 receptor domain-containing adapter protein n=1 Tax=Sardina pilchardus TaxID=27697 RepID=UPI002E0EE2C4
MQVVPSDGASPSHASQEQSLPSALTSAFRWSLEYDLCVCHSDDDYSEAECLVSYLEDTVRGLRCFLPMRDCPPGSPIPTELCRAVQNSHCWLFLMTSHFLQSEWCIYQMHQALAEAPMSNRIIPTVLHLPYSSCPKEIRFYYIIDLIPKAGKHEYDRVYKAVLQYLEGGVEKDNSSSTSTAAISDTEKDFSSLPKTDANVLHRSTAGQQKSPQSRKVCNIM